MPVFWKILEWLLSLDISHVIWLPVKKGPKKLFENWCAVRFCAAILYLSSPTSRRPLHIKFHLHPKDTLKNSANIFKKFYNIFWVYRYQI